MAIFLTNNITVGPGVPLDSKYFSEVLVGGVLRPWDSITEVNQNLNISTRHRGLTVNINGVEYWYKDGVTDNDLVVKSLGSSGSGITGLTFNNTTDNKLVIGTEDGDFEATINNLETITVKNLNISTNGAIRSYNGLTNLTGQFLSGTTNGFVLAPISNLTVDTQVTGFTYNPLGNQFSLLRNNGLPNLNVTVNSFSGLSVTDLTTNRLVYANSSGKLVSSSSIFDPSTGNLTINGNMNASGATFTENVTVLGDLTIIGTTTSAFTNNLFVEDQTITVNFNPTASTVSTSIGAGLVVQDGSGVQGENVNFTVKNLNSLVGITVGQTPNLDEYTGIDGFGNRGWITQLNDIVIRSNNLNTPSGVRVLAEFDILDGGSF
jgi:hypothetical protein